MRQLIEVWGIPKGSELDQREIKFCFDEAELATPHELCDGLQCEWDNVKFCLYDTQAEKPIFICDFFIIGSTAQVPTLKLGVIATIDPDLRGLGIATYYLEKLKRYAIEENIMEIKIHVNANSLDFECLDKQHTLSNEQLISWYCKHLQTETFSDGNKNATILLVREDFVIVRYN